MGISITDPISSAIDCAKRVCFKPFDIGKWFSLGFCAWLAQLGEGGFNFNFPSPSNRGSGNPPEEFRQASQSIGHWVQTHVLLVIGLAVAAVIVVVALMLVFMWLSSRGRFMFIDGVVHNRGLVKDPWHRFRERANSLFGFRIVFALAAMGTLLAVIAVSVFPALAMRSGPNDSGPLFFGLAIGIPLGLAWLFITIFIRVVLEDFVVPVMYLRNVRVMDAWHIARHELLPGNLGLLVLYLLLRLALMIAVIVVIVVAVCATCCLAVCVLLLPYLGTVALLPVLVFSRAYPLYVLEQFGDRWRIFPPPAPAPEFPEVPPAPGHYDPPKWPAPPQY